MVPGKVKFEHINIIISIIIGLSITKLLEIFAVLLRDEHFQKISFLQITWMVILFLAQIQFWWSINRYETKEYGFVQYLLFMISPILMFVMCMLIIPQELEKEIDGIVFFDRNKSLFYMLATFVIFFNIVNALILRENKKIGIEKLLQISVMFFLVFGAVMPDCHFFDIILPILVSFLILILFINFNAQNDSN